MKKVTEYVEIIFNDLKNIDVEQLEKIYHQEIIKITNKCPACDQKISTNDAKCGSCGLHLIA